LYVECEHDDDIYGHSYDDRDYGTSPGTGMKTVLMFVTVLCVVFFLGHLTFKVVWRLLLFSYSVVIIFLCGDFIVFVYLLMTRSVWSA
jgi:hypothetical protein